MITWRKTRKDFGSRITEVHFLKTTVTELSWVLFVLARRTKSRLLVIKRMVVVPKLPKNANGKVFIHLGCGDIASPEFINVDARPGPHVHYICDVTDLSIFPDGYADLVYASHVLEHVRHNGLKKTLWEWRRILKPGGILRLSVPDFDKILHIYQSSARRIDSILGPLMGGQDHKYNVHYSVFNQEYLTDRLREAGFREIRQWDPDSVANHNFRDWANSDIVQNGRAFPVSLNLEAVK
jgi:predicted SAM-dependent methyltransferase